MNPSINFDTLLNTQTDNLNTHIEIINVIEALRENLGDENFQNLDEILQINSLLIVLNMTKCDCLIISKDFILPGGSYLERHFYVKSFYLVVYNFFSCYTEYGKLLEKIIDKTGPLKPEYSIVKQKIKDFRSKYKYDEKINVVRNKISAHIDTDWKKNLKLMSEINNKESGEMLLEFIPLTDQLTQFLLSIIINNQLIDLNLSKQLREKFIVMKEKYKRG